MKSEMFEIVSFPQEEIAEKLANVVMCGVTSYPADAAANVERELAMNFGPVVTKIRSLIASGLVDPKAIMAVLWELFPALPWWVTMIVQILLAVTPKPAPPA